MILYLLSVALILAACFIFYKVLLQQETFFPLNRFILIGCLALSFSIPLIRFRNNGRLEKQVRK
ncbi:hypothetical protein [Pedobacter sp. UC225_65]|uniref:hypothetical protein n=1 Tax=Pedobacter sp. UC225_65 TaxID=3350173 RepID=UPI00366E34C8